jgi:Uma2 family endonuclease
MQTKCGATIEDLYRVPGKAELIDGGLVLMAPTGARPNLAAGAIYASLREYARRTKTGHAFTDNMGFVVRVPKHRSFSPDAAFFTGEIEDPKFAEGAPDFAVEVRSAGDYGRAAERKVAQKRAAYFAAGTRVVWDVDVLREDLVRKYTADDPETSVVFRRGEDADAEPALSGWRMAVDELFE